MLVAVDGEEFDGGKGENYNLEIGSGSFIPGFEDQLIGLKAGEEKDVEVTFPEEYGAENLAGKDAVFKCKVNEIRTVVAAEINDDLAKLKLVWKQSGRSERRDSKKNVVQRIRTNDASAHQEAPS